MMPLLLLLLLRLLLLLLLLLLCCFDRVPAALNIYVYVYHACVRAQGLAIGNSETIRSVHNGFSRQEPFFNDGQDDGGKKEDAFHFVAYLPHDGKASLTA